MNKKIIIKSCNECPYTNHKGSFHRVSYIPYCIKIKRKDNILPYSINDSYNFLSASPTWVIPKWCPLEDNNE